MKTEIIDLAPYAITIIISVLASYFSKTFSLEKEVEKLKIKMDLLEKRTDSHSKKIDKVLDGINDIRETLAKLNTEIQNLKEEEI